VQLGEVILTYSENVLTSQDEAFRKVSKKELTDLVEKLELLFVFANKNLMGLPDPQIYRVAELVHLNFALRCLQLPVLEKKLIGGTLLIMKVLQVKKSIESGTVTKWLDQD